MHYDPEEEQQAQNDRAAENLSKDERKNSTDKHTHRERERQRERKIRKTTTKSEKERHVIILMHT